MTLTLSEPTGKLSELPSFAKNCGNNVRASSLVKWQLIELGRIGLLMRCIVAGPAQFPKQMPFSGLVPHAQRMHKFGTMPRQTRAHTSVNCVEFLYPSYVYWSAQYVYMHGYDHVFCFPNMHGPMQNKYFTHLLSSCIFNPKVFLFIWGRKRCETA